LLKVTEKFKDHPEVQKLFKSIRDYYNNIKYLGIQDYQVRKISPGFWSNVPRFLYSLTLVIISSVFALPGALLNGPIALVIRFLSERERKKALAASTVKLRGTDVLASHKMLCAICAFPLAALVWTYAFNLVCKHFTNFDPSVIHKLTIIFLFIWPLYSYAMIRSADGAVRHFRNMKARFLVLLFGEKIRQLQEAREKLQERVREFVDKHGAEVLEDFERTRIINNDRFRKDSFDLAKAFEFLEEMGL